MKRFMITAILLTLAIAWCSAQHFDRYFVNKTMRVDYYHTGTNGEETISLDKVYEESIWSGTRNHLSDPLKLGEFMVRGYDLASNILIFSQGYSSLFNEWQTTDEALAGIHMDYVFVHELGHSFGGLSDEYYTSSVAYNDFNTK
ncbi:MAG: peptidase M64 N-terminal domain-containing protein [bacterium]